jgi:hypothetical protein
MPPTVIPPTPPLGTGPGKSGEPPAKGPGKP